ncbi:hypothetical protein F2P81_004176 [Scophthalmus maximus]|uniref:Uncharacterized protein n=1 Tax=Scophthalmus maximus TaxID=52904 RepID=A0A6A4TD63_SCOMX|nr:hypothetical protein F2P81_004176 [Scophthalmus maximus]
MGFGVHRVTSSSPEHGDQETRVMTDETFAPDLLQIPRFSLSRCEGQVRRGNGNMERGRRITRLMQLPTPPPHPPPLQSEKEPALGEAAPRKKSHGSAVDDPSSPFLSALSLQRLFSPLH